MESAIGLTSTRERVHIPITEGKLYNFDARVFQHELDHLVGIII